MISLFFALKTYKVFAKLLFLKLEITFSQILQLKFKITKDAFHILIKQ